jgi:hypothetical protein
MIINCVRKSIGLDKVVDEDERVKAKFKKLCVATCSDESSHKLEVYRMTSMITIE